MAEERVRIEIAFEGGQILGVTSRLAAADELERALATAATARSLEAEDGRYTVALRRSSSSSASRARAASASAPADAR